MCIYSLPAVQSTLICDMWVLKVIFMCCIFVFALNKRQMKMYSNNTFKVIRLQGNFAVFTNKKRMSRFAGIQNEVWSRKLRKVTIL